MPDQAPASLGGSGGGVIKGSWLDAGSGCGGAAGAGDSSTTITAVCGGAGVTMGVCAVGVTWGWAEDGGQAGAGGLGGGLG